MTISQAFRSVDGLFTPPEDLAPAIDFAWWEKVPVETPQWSPDLEHFRAKVNSGATSSLNLGFVPARSISLTLDDITELTVRVAESVQNVRLVISGETRCSIVLESTAPTFENLYLDSDSLSHHVEIRVGKFDSLTIDKVDVRLLPLPYYAHWLRDKPTRSDVVVRRGRLAIVERAIRNIEVSDSSPGDWSVIELRGGSTVEALKIAKGLSLILNADGGCDFGVVENLSGDPHRFTDAQLRLVNGSVLRMKRAELDTICVDEDAQLTLMDDQGPISICGPGLVQVESSARGLNFLDPPPRLVMARYSQVVDAAGPVRLQEAQDARLAGALQPGGSLIEGLEVRDIPGDSSVIKGMSLVNFKVPVTLHGLQVLTVIRENAILATPLLHPGLPGWSKLHGLLRPPKSRGGRDHSKALAEPPKEPGASTKSTETEYASAISALSHIGNSPASVRTMLAWCAYRVRHSHTTGKVERLILWAYRLIGYGERPMPAFILYFFLALLMSLIWLRHEGLTLTTAGISHFLTVTTGWLISPLHLLNLTQDKDSIVGFSQPWDTFARLLIAAPFATGLLALRKYVKDETSDTQSGKGR